MNHDKDWTKEDEEQIPSLDAYTPKPEITPQSMRRELMGGLTELSILTGGCKMEGRTNDSALSREKFFVLLIFGVNAGLISKLEFNQFQAMMRRGLGEDT